MTDQSKYSVRLQSLVIPDQKEMTTLNLFYIALVPGLATMAGSVSSIIIIGGVLWAYIQMARGLAPVSRSMEIRLICLFYAGFFLTEVLAGVLNWHGFQTISALVGNVLFILLFPLTCSLMAKREEMIAFLQGGAAVFSFLSVIFGAIQFFMLGYRAEGASGNPGVFAILCAVLYAIDIIAVFHCSGMRRLLFAMAALAACSALVLSEMRALWLCILVTPLIVFAIYRRQVTRRFLVASLCVVAIFAVLIAVFFRDLLVGRFLLTMLEIDSVSDGKLGTSIGHRIALWQAGWSLFLERPIFGWGPGNYAEELKQKTIEYAGYPLFYSHFHNLFLNAGVRSGSVGIVALVLCIVGPVFLAARRVRDRCSRYGFALMTCTIATFFISGLTGIMFGHDILVSNFMVLIAVAMALSFRADDAPAASNRSMSGN